MHVPVGTRVLLTAVAVAFFTALSSPANASAQAVEPRAPVQGTEVGGRMHLQFNTTSATGEEGSEFFVRRARIWASTRVNDWIDGAVQVEDCPRGREGSTSWTSARSFPKAAPPPCS